MKIVTQNLKNGETTLANIPCPVPDDREVLIRSNRTLVSAGTERMLVDFGKANLLRKALQQPDKVKMVLQKLKTDGIQATVETVLNKLDVPLPLGYCNVGSVLATGAGAGEYEVGDRVVSNGFHAEAVCVPLNLTAKVPANVSDDEAAFTVLGAIAMQGIRLAKPTLGECFVVSGLGLVGLMTVQLLRANGCRVLGLDFDHSRLSLAEQFGAETFDLSQGASPLSAAQSFSRGRGVDGVLLTAATHSDEPISQAAQMCRKLGRVILVGVTGLNLSRDDFFKKEISFQVSASYGPGRYDPNYEEKGQDYPIGYVRWTERRNFEAVLDMMASGVLDVRSLISHRFDLESCEEAYGLISGAEPSLGVLLDYPRQDTELSPIINLGPQKTLTQNLDVEHNGVGMIGAGNYAKGVLIPAFRRNGAMLDTIVSSGGLSSWHSGKKFGFKNAATDPKLVFNNPEIRDVVITTRHNTHAAFVKEALRAGKNIFVEKPLCLTHSELNEIEQLYQSMGSSSPILMVGFNRRFAPLTKVIKRALSSVNEPKSMIMKVNAGAISADHWTQDKDIGGGRILGEACHFIDLLRFIVGHEIVGYDISKMRGMPQDTASMSINFADGSIGTIHYFANGHKSVPKETLDIYCGGRIVQLENFTNIKSYGWGSLKNRRLWRQDKGQNDCVRQFLIAAETRGSSPIPADEIFETHRVAIELQNA